MSTIVGLAVAIFMFMLMLWVVLGIPTLRRWAGFGNLEPSGPAASIASAIS